MQVTTRALFIAIFLLTVAAARAQTPPMASGPRAQRLLSGTHSGQETGVGCADLDGEVAKALIDLGEQARSDSLERATTAFRLAERAARCAGSEPLTGTALNGLSDVLIRRGEIDAALTAAHESIRVHEHLKDNGGQAEAWKNVANAEWAHSAINSSVAIHRALDLWIAAGNSQGEAIALNNIGNLHKAAGELDAALEYQTRALRILEDIGDWRRAAVVTNNMGINYFNRGEYATALGYNQRALALHRAAGNQYGVGTSLDSSGNI